MNIIKVDALTVSEKSSNMPNLHIFVEECVALLGAMTDKWM